VVGPWNHLGMLGADVELGRTDVGPGEDGRMGQLRRVIPWLHAHLKGEGVPPIGAGTRVHGAERWVERPAWPPPTAPLTLWLDPRAPAGGALVDAPSSPDPALATLSYVYDPARPTPSVGGAGILLGAIPGL